MYIVKAIFGIALLFLGRQLYWLVVGSVGFILGLQFAPLIVPGPYWLTLLIALGAGIIGAFLVITIQKIALGLIGFLAGGYILLSLSNLVHLNIGQLTWFPFLIGGLLGIFLQIALYDWTLIFLSSFLGIIYIVDAFNISNPGGYLLATGLFVIGVLIQANSLREEVLSKHGR
jgi:hypothetical protein